MKKEEIDAIEARANAFACATAIPMAVSESGIVTARVCSAAVAVRDDVLRLVARVRELENAIERDWGVEVNAVDHKARADEREKIASWLRKRTSTINQAPSEWDNARRSTLAEAADAIRKGEHND